MCDPELREGNVIRDTLGQQAKFKFRHKVLKLKKDETYNLFSDASAIIYIERDTDL